MIQIAYVVEEQIPCEPGAELCGDCEHLNAVLYQECPVFDEKVLFTDNPLERARRCPACLLAERRAALRVVWRARLAKREVAK